MQSSPINCLLKCSVTLTHHIQKEEEEAQGQKRRIKLRCESCFQQRDNINKENEILVSIRS